MSAKSSPSGAPPPGTPDSGEKATLRRSRRIWVFFGIVALLCAAVLLPETRYLRYADEFRDLANPIFCDDRDVDVVFLGSSRMARSVDAFSIAKAYRDLTGEDLTIVDLSKTGPSDAVMGILLSDLLEHRRAKLVIAEMGRPRMGQQWKILEKMGRVMPFKDYYRYAKETSKQGPLGVLWEAVQLRLAFLEGGLSTPWTGCSPQTEANVVDHTLALPKIDEFEKFTRRVKKNGLRPFYEHYLKKPMQFQMNTAHTVIDLTRNSGGKIMFMSVNTFQDEQVSIDNRQKFSKIFGAELTTWPPELYDFLRKEYLYSDSSHLDEDGAQLAAAWYAEKIRSYLSASDQPQQRPAPEERTPAGAASG